MPMLFSGATNKPLVVAQYFLARAVDVGDLITNLKMQKLVYYGYAGVLVCLDKKLFEERIEAWPNGPVVRPLYGELKEYGAGPIPESLLNMKSAQDLANSIGEQESEVLERVFRRYGSMSPFELVVMTHAEQPWKQARKGLSPGESSTNLIDDEIIKATYTREDFDLDPEWNEG